MRSGVSASPHVSESTQPVDIRIRGFVPNKPAIVRVEARDASGRRWVATASYETNKHGNIDTATFPALSGSYSGVWAMGLVATMQPKPAPRADVSFRWPDGRRQPFQVTAVQGAKRFALTIERELGDVSLLRANTTVRHDGFLGAYYAPAAERHHEALLVFGGSEGGLASRQMAASFAANGYPALALAYFGAPGLPQTLTDVPLEYFVRALRWLEAQPQVDASRVFVLGVSRGSEAAQLLGVHFPKLVHGVVAVVPSDFVNCAYPICNGSAWTLNGVPLPYEPRFGTLAPVDTPAARIPDERIRGPILFVCAALDEDWPSCPYSHIALTILRNDAYPHELIEAPSAYHGLGALVPYEPSTGMTNGQERLNERGREGIWPQVLAFLHQNG